jgi:hypothetical protein
MPSPSREATLESVLLLASFTLILLGIVSTVQDAPDDPIEGTRINDRKQHVDSGMKEGTQIGHAARDRLFS